MSKLTESRASSLIKDSDLETYLDGKLLVKPAYPLVMGSTEVESDYKAIKARMDSDRKKSNDSVKRNYGLRPRS